MNFTPTNGLPVDQKQLSPNRRLVDLIRLRHYRNGMTILRELHVHSIKAGMALLSAKVPTITATKSMTGHLLGAAGAVESIISILSIKNNIIPATINTQNPDEELPEGIDLVLHQSRKQKVTYVMNNTFGFGGHAACSIFKKY